MQTVMTATSNHPIEIMGPLSLLPKIRVSHGIPCVFISYSRFERILVAHQSAAYWSRLCPAVALVRDWRRIRALILLVVQQMRQLFLRIMSAAYKFNVRHGGGNCALNSGTALDMNADTSIIARQYPCNMPVFRLWSLRINRWLRSTCRESNQLRVFQNRRWHRRNHLRIALTCWRVIW